MADGGWQVGHAWFAAPHQTWSATGYLRMIYAGLFGMRFQSDGQALAPALPEGWSDVSLTGVRYRRTVLQIQLHGAGAVVRSFQVDGVEQAEHVLPVGLRGEPRVEIVPGGLYVGVRAVIEAMWCLVGGGAAILESGRS